MGGAGNWFYNRFGHENTRLAYAAIGFLMVTGVIIQFIEIIWATSFGKIVILAFFLILAGLVLYLNRRWGTYKNKKNKVDKENIDEEN